jgi:hypothetical protein
MTTAATVVGHFPLILASGAGARNSIGVMLVSGMIVGTIFTLLVVGPNPVNVPQLHMRRSQWHTPTDPCTCSILPDGNSRYKKTTSEAR